MNYFEYALRLCTGTVLGIVSTAALVLALSGLVTTPQEQNMALAAGISLQLGLYLFARSEKDLAVSWVLFAVSIAATAAFMEYAYQEQQSATLSNQTASNAGSYRAQQLKQEIAELNREITIRLDVSKRDTSGSYTTRGLKQLNSEVSTLRQQRNTKTQALNNITTITTNTPSGSVQAAVNNVPTWARWMVWFSLAALLDLVAIRCLQTPFPKKKETSTEAAKPETMLAGSEIKTAYENELETKTDQTVTEIQDPSQVRVITEIADRVRKGQYGHYPVVRKIIEAEGVRHPIVKQAFLQLQAEGALCKNGQRFELITDPDWQAA